MGWCQKISNLKENIGYFVYGVEMYIFQKLFAKVLKKIWSPEKRKLMNLPFSVARGPTFYIRIISNYQLNANSFS